MEATPVTLVMTGRGVDQILPHPGAPEIFEPYVRSAADYVELAEQATGKIERPVSFEYIGGDSLTELERIQPDVRIVNLGAARRLHHRRRRSQAFENGLICVNKRPSQMPMIITLTDQEERPCLPS